MYADYAFYVANYYGDELTDENAPKWLSRASDMLDIITHRRTAESMPTEQSARVAVSKACCAIAEALYKAEMLGKASRAQVMADGTVRGPVASISSGRESISYGAGGSNASRYAAAASDPGLLYELAQDAAVAYIANVCDANGVNLLYAGRR